LPIFLVFLYLTLQFACLFFVELLLGAFYEADDISHAEDTVGHALGVEHVEGVHLLAGADELDGLVDDGTYGQGGTAAGVTVELCQHHAVEVETVVEFLGGVDGVLSRHGVDDEECLVGLCGLLDGGDFLHQRFVDGQSSGGVDDDGVVGLRLGFVYTLQGYLHGVLRLHVHIDGHLYLLGEDAQLLDGGGSVDVAGHQQGASVAFRLEQVGQFPGECRLTGTVETGHQDDGGMSLELQFGGLSSHQCGELVVDDFDHELSRLDARQHVLSQCFLLHRVGKRLGHFVVDVGVEEGAAHLLEGFRHIDFGDAALALQYLERPLKSLVEVFKHI
jgi:hypothetical protein